MNRFTRFPLSHHNIAIAREFRIRQTPQPAGNLLFLGNLLALPVRHAELEQEDHWHHTVDRKRL